MARIHHPTCSGPGRPFPQCFLVGRFAYTETEAEHALTTEIRPPIIIPIVVLECCKINTSMKSPVRVEEERLLSPSIDRYYSPVLVKNILRNILYQNVTILCHNHETHRLHSPSERYFFVSLVHGLLYDSSC